MTQERIARNVAVRLLGEDEYLTQTNPAALKRWHPWQMRILLRYSWQELSNQLYAPFLLLKMLMKHKPGTTERVTQCQ